MDWGPVRRTARGPLEFVRALGNWTAGEGPAYRRLAAALTLAIRRGEVGPGERLPAERVMARLLSVSRTTVVAAYELLREDGWLESRQGSGTRVASGSSAPPGLPSEEGSGSFRGHPLYRGLIEGSGGTIEFLAAHLPGGDFLVPDLAAIDRRALAELVRGAGYMPMGLPELRSSIAAYLSSRGLPTSVEQILVTCGAQQAVRTSVADLPPARRQFADTAEAARLAARHQAALRPRRCAQAVTGSTVPALMNSRSADSGMRTKRPT